MEEGSYIIERRDALGSNGGVKAKLAAFIVPDKPPAARFRQLFSFPFRMGGAPIFPNGIANPDPQLHTLRPSPDATCEMSARKLK